MMKYRRTTLNGGVKGVAILPGKGVLTDEPTLSLLCYPDLVIPLLDLFGSCLESKVLKLIIKHKRFSLMMYEQGCILTNLWKQLNYLYHRLRRFKTPNVNLNGLCL